MLRYFSVLCVAFLVGVAPASAAPEDKKPEPKPVVAVFRIGGEITESPSGEDFLFSFSGGGPVSFKDLIARLKKAGDDKAVKAVVLLTEGGLGAAQIEEVRQAIAKLRSADKEVLVHSDSMSMGQYLLASGASRISVVPTGDLNITGLFGEGMYIRGLLDKLGVKPDFLTCGEFKSAAEMFMREAPSPAADKMQNWLLDSTYETFVNLIAKGRKLEPEKVKAIIDAGPYSAEKAKAAGLIDAVEHRQDFTAMLKNKFGKDVTFNKKYGQKKGLEPDFSSPFAMLKIWGELLGEATKKKSTKPAVGIVYVDGPIMVGKSAPSLFGAGGAMSTEIRKALDEAAKDDAIKAVVLRVDSPGGSAVASEIILDATRRVKAKKPFVVSMGNVAGSGGYYVACGADTIFADEATITGSIGVVSGKLGTKGMWNKVGVTFKEYKRGQNAGMLNSGDVFSKEEREKMQAYMDEIYDVFKGHVVKIRGDRLKKPIDDLAGGRVYTGKQALELGLVDKIGSMQDAISFVAEQAKLPKDYEVRVVPEPKNFLEILLEDAGGGKEDTKDLDTSVRRVAPAGRQPISLVELALPHLQHLDPRRVKAVKDALRSLQLIHQEGVLMLMPQKVIWE